MNSEKLQYYQHNPKKAFHDGFVGNTSFEMIGGKLYHGWKFFVPRGCVKKSHFLKRYFEYVDNKPTTCPRRYDPCEWAETTLMIFQRIDSFLRRNQPFAAGSSLVSALPWAIFGQSEKMARNYFYQLTDISKYYSNFLHGDCRGVQTHFRQSPDIVFDVAARFDKFPLNSPNFWMGVAVCLIVDIIYNCAHDCAPVFELYTNDSAISPGNMPNQDWQELRCRILGVDIDPMLGLPRVPGKTKVSYRPKRLKTEITMIGECDDLTAGEKILPLRKPEPVLVKDEEVYGPPIPVSWLGVPYLLNNDIQDTYSRMKNGRGRLAGFCEGMI